jgi:hypothetical protein
MARAMHRFLTWPRRRQERPASRRGPLLAAGLPLGVGLAGLAAGLIDSRFAGCPALAAALGRASCCSAPASPPPVWSRSPAPVLLLAGVLLARAGRAPLRPERRPAADEDAAITLH